MPVQTLQAHAMVTAIKQKAISLGFDLVGIASADPSQHREYFRGWLERGNAGDMHYLERRFEERTDVAAYFPGAKSVVCLAMNYHVSLADAPTEGDARPGRVARYALGDDYHVFMKDRLYLLADWMRQVAPESATRCAVDTAPILERELAARAGIGWVGKNTCIIHPRMGSWLLLGEVITTLPLPVDEPLTDHCGTCTRCIDACPTGAITEPYHLDARRCISYLTIEQREPLPPEMSQQIGNWLYGCDVCQEVCPHNRRAPNTDEPALQPRFATGTMDLLEVQRWTEVEYRATLKGSAMKRVKLPVLQYNAERIIQNLQESEA